MKTSGNTILITGAAKGIGLEIASLFSQKAKKLIMADRAIDKLETEVAKLDNPIAIGVDLNNDDSKENFIQTLQLNHDYLNIAILNWRQVVCPPAHFGFGNLKRFTSRDQRSDCPNKI